MVDIPDEEMIIVKIRDIKGQKLEQFKTLEKDGIVEIRALHPEEKRWVIQSFKIPLKELGFDKKTKQKEILNLLNQPFTITNSKIKKFIIKIFDTYEGFQTDKKNFKTKRFKRKRKTPEAKKSPRA
ncbi:MAG: hypothetical protein EAX96_15375 [Candidatus Lokiarchaeota archaeon]|nr:hypothetical protein [Candidatus Lokiarchaeota archaeon]